MFWNYCYLNRNLTINYNGSNFISKNGLKDLLGANMDGSPLYPIVHLEGDDIEVALLTQEDMGKIILLLLMDSTQHRVEPIKVHSRGYCKSD